MQIDFSKEQIESLCCDRMAQEADALRWHIEDQILTVPKE